MPTRLRYALLILMLGLAAGASLWRQHTRQQEPQSTATQAVYAYHIDVAGWYAATQNETVVYARFPLSMDDVASTLPTSLESWYATDLGTDSDIEKWFDEPDLVMRRQYASAEQPAVWLSAIGSRGAKSFHIFEHTPASCYPSADWFTQSDEVYHVALDHGALPVNRAVYTKAGITRIVYYWYQWDSPTRDAEEGVTSWRIATDVARDPATADGRLGAVLRLIYQQSLTYHRF